MTWRNAAYLSWVRSLQCCMTGVEPAGDAHHGIGLKMSGMGMKAPDWTAMPLTRIQHTYMHNSPDLWPDQWEYIARTLGRAIEDGFFIPNPAFTETPT